MEEQNLWEQTQNPIEIAEEKREREHTGNKRPDLLRVLFFLCDLVLTGYLVGILAVHPFYMTAGYLQLGTDKAMFFRRFTMAAGAAFLPLAALTLLGSVISRARSRKQASSAGVSPQAGARYAAHLLRKPSATEGLAALYGLVLFGSYLLSVHRETALWGEKGWYLGFLPKLFCILVFLAYSRFWVFPDLIPAMVFPVSAVVFGMEILERFGLSFWEFPGANPEKLATIGNINWFCGYLTAVFFAGAALLWSRRAGKQRVVTGLLLVYVFLGTVSLLTQGSASGYLAYLVCLCVFLRVSRDYTKWTLRSFELLLLFGISCACIFAAGKAGLFTYTYTDPVSGLLVGSTLSLPVLAVTVLCFGLAVLEDRSASVRRRPVLGTLAGMLPGVFVFLAGLFFLLLLLNTWQQGWPFGGDAQADSLLYFNDNWGSNRGSIWKAALSLFGAQPFLHKLFGVGPDCFYRALCAPGAEEVLARVNDHFGGARLTNAHNIFLNLLVDEGLAGLACYCGMTFTAITRFLRAGFYTKEGGWHGRTALACGMSVLAILTNELFSFEQTMTIVLLAVTLGIGEQALAKREQKDT